MNRSIFLMVVTFAGGCVIQGCAADTTSTQESKGETLAQLTVGESGIQYANLDVPETLPVGPAGLFATRDGFAVPDNAQGAIVLLDRQFGVRKAISFRGQTRGILSVTQDGEDIVALDTVSDSPKLLRFSPQGTIKSTGVSLEANVAPTGIRQDDLGLVLEYSGGDSLYRVVDGGDSAEMAAIDGYTWNGVKFSVGKMVDPELHERVIHVGEAVGLVRVPNQLGATHIVGSDGENGVYVLVEDVALTDKVTVNQSVWHLDASGKTVGVSMVPLEMAEVHMLPSVAIDGIGKPVVMVPLRASIKFLRAATLPANTILDLKPVKFSGLTKDAFGDGRVGALTQNLITYNGSCLSSSQMVSNAQEYANVSLSYTSNNINNNGTCTTRQKPAYLGSPGTYSSVSYDWGGWDTPSAYSSALAGGGKAGNLNTASSLSCSYGVDCSGFLTRVWGFSDWKRSTSDIPGGATSKGPAYGPGYFVGDAFNLVGVHTVMFAGLSGSGLMIWEASGEPYAKVVNRYSNWSYLSGYSSWRSLTSCN
ncbi:MAG: hypothetical protein RLZZ324_631 [Candidatus Parcubacteria bacterium]